MPILSAASSTGNDIRRTPQKYYAEPGAHYETIIERPRRSTAYSTRDKTRPIPYYVEPRRPGPDKYQYPTDSKFRGSYYAEPDAPYETIVEQPRRIRRIYPAEPYERHITAVGGSRPLRHVSREGRHRGSIYDSARHPQEPLKSSPHDTRPNSSINASSTLPMRRGQNLDKGDNMAGSVARGLLPNTDTWVDDRFRNGIAPAARRSGGKDDVVQRERSATAETTSSLRITVKPTISEDLSRQDKDQGAKLRYLQQKLARPTRGSFDARGLQKHGGTTDRPIVIQYNTTPRSPRSIIRYDR